MATTFYGDNLTYINNVCTAYIGENVAAVAAAIAPAAFMLLGVYVMLWGYASLRGLIEEPIMDLAARLLKISLIFSIGIGLAEFNVLITDTLFNGPEQLAAVLTHAPSSSGVVNSLDALFDQGFQIGKQFWIKGGILHGDFGMYIVALTVWTETVAVTAYAFFLMVLSKFALTIIISLGSLFIISLLFDSTAAYFNSWVQQMTNYFLVPVLVVATNLLVMTLFSRAAEGAVAMTSTTDIDQIFPFFAMGLVSLLVLGSILTMAAGLSGGMALSSFGVGRLAARILGTGAKKALGTGAKVAGIGTKKVARAGWTAYQNRNRNSISTPKGELHAPPY